MRSTNEWIEALVESVADLTPTVRRLTLRPLAAVTSPEPGSHLQVRLQAGGKEVTRSYSLTGSAGGAWTIAVKRLDDGQGGSLAMWRLAPGDRLAVSGPHNHFPLDLQAPAYLLVAGGIGITPLLPMAKVLAARGANVRMLYGARTQAELAFADELRECLGGSLQAVAGSRADIAGAVAALAPGGQMYVCGPASMLDAARHAWEAGGRPPADLRYETFGSGGRLASREFRVQVPRHGLDIMVPAGRSLLDVLEEAGVQTLSDCRRGECGLCAVEVLGVEGEIDHRDVFLSEHEKRQNRRICACVSRAAGCLMLDSPYRPDSSP